MARTSAVLILLLYDIQLYGLISTILISNMRADTQFLQVTRTSGRLSSNISNFIRLIAIFCIFLQVSWYWRSSVVILCEYAWQVSRIFLIWIWQMTFYRQHFQSHFGERRSLIQIKFHSSCCSKDLLECWKNGLLDRVLVIGVVVVILFPEEYNNTHSTCMIFLL